MVCSYECSSSIFGVEEKCICHRNTKIFILRYYLKSGPWFTRSFFNHHKGQLVWLENLSHHLKLSIISNEASGG